MAINYRETLSPKEYEEFNQRKEMFEMQAQHELAVKEKELELMRLEAKWASWIKIPLVIVTLPVRILFGFAYICSVFTKKEMPPEFWSMLK